MERINNECFYWRAIELAIMWPLGDPDKSAAYDETWRSEKKRKQKNEKKT